MDKIPFDEKAKNWNPAKFDNVDVKNNIIDFDSKDSSMKGIIEEFNNNMNKLKTEDRPRFIQGNKDDAFKHVKEMPLSEQLRFAQGKDDWKKQFPNNTHDLRNFETINKD